MNKNIFDYKGKIGRKWYWINALILAIVCGVFTSLGFVGGREISPIVFSLLLVAIYVFVLKSFNYKKRFLDITNNPRLSVILTGTFIVISLLPQVYSALVKIHLKQTVSSISDLPNIYPNIEIPNFLFTQPFVILNYALLGIGLITWLFLLFKKGQPEQEIAGIEER